MSASATASTTPFLTSGRVAPRKVRFINDELNFGSAELQELRDSNALLDDMAAMRARFAEDGYLLIRGMHQRDTIEHVRSEMIRCLEKDQRIDGSKPRMEGWIAPNQTSSFGELAYADGFRAAVEAPHLMGFFERFLGGTPMTFDFKWTRAVGTGDATGAHLDTVYMGRGTPNLFTCWTPWGDLSLEMGTLAIAVGSHRLPGWQKVHDTYGKLDVDRDPVGGGWFSDHPKKVIEAYGGHWATTEFQAGDVLMFGMKTMHASLTNVTNRFRLTSDTRYQLATDPIDERWISKAGKAPIGHYQWLKGDNLKSMEQYKQEWGITV